MADPSIYLHLCVETTGKHMFWMVLGTEALLSNKENNYGWGHYNMTNCVKGLQLEEG